MITAAIVDINLTDPTERGHGHFRYPEAGYWYVVN